MYKLSSFASWRLCVKSHRLTQSRKVAKNLKVEQFVLTDKVPVKAVESEEITP